MSIVGKKQCLRCEGKGFEDDAQPCPDCKGAGVVDRYACVGANCRAEGIWQPVIVVPIVKGGPHPMMMVQKNAVCDTHRAAYRLLDWAGTDWYELARETAASRVMLEMDPCSGLMIRVKRPLEIVPMERCWVTFRPCGWSPKPRPLFPEQRVR